MSRRRNEPLPSGEEISDPLRHLSNFGACSPTMIDELVELLGLDLTGWTINEIMMSTTIDSRSGRGAWAHRVARTICNDHCGLKEFCLDTALSMPAVATDGFWGGLNVRERRRLRRRLQDTERQTRRAEGAPTKVG